MSYLPRMSKTYKEPVVQEEEPKDNLSLSRLQPASSLVSEGTFNPQATLKHYKYFPHPPPVLPGPSVAEEANENELFREASRMRRSCAIINEQSSNCCLSVETLPSGSSHSLILDDKLTKETIHSKEWQPKRQNFQSHSKAGLSKKKSSKILADKKKDNGKSDQFDINLCLLESDMATTFTAAQTPRHTVKPNVANTSEASHKNETENKKYEKSVPTFSYSIKSKNSRNNIKKERKNTLKNNHSPHEVIHCSIQCTIFGCPDKKFVIPHPVNALLKALAFLLYEVNKEEAFSYASVECKRIMTQVQLILGDLCNQNTEKNFNFDITYSDSKRVEKIFEDLKKYIKSVYDDKGECMDKAEALKKTFMQLKLRELELGILHDKFQENESLQVTEVKLKESDYKNPHVTLQNKRLESEQLLAEVEFSNIELKSCQTALAEADWEIKIAQDNIVNLKKMSTSKSWTELLGKKPSAQKIMRATLEKENKYKESDNKIINKKKG